MAIVGLMVTATSGLPDDKQGLATGWATMSQQVGITMGIPIMSAIATARIHSLGGERAHRPVRRDDRDLGQRGIVRGNRRAGRDLPPAAGRRD